MPTAITYDVADGIATITLNRPDRLDAFTQRMCDEMIEAFDASDIDDDVRAVVVTGAGRAFCAGADLGRGAETFLHGGGGAGSGRDTGGVLRLRIFRSLKPVIAAMNGPAVGVGASMTLPMDIRVLAEEAKVGFVFAAPWDRPGRRGQLVPPPDRRRAPGPRVVPHRPGVRGRGGAGRCLVRSIHPADEVVEVARGLAKEIAANVAPVSAVITRQLIWQMLGAPHPMDADIVDSQAIRDTGRLADAAEGVIRSSKKRRPAGRCGRPWTCPPGSRGRTSLRSLPQAGRPPTRSLDRYLAEHPATLWRLGTAWSGRVATQPSGRHGRLKEELVTAASPTVERGRSWPCSSIRGRHCTAAESSSRTFSMLWSVAASPRWTHDERTITYGVRPSSCRGDRCTGSPPTSPTPRSRTSAPPGARDRHRRWRPHPPRRSAEVSVLFARSGSGPGTGGWPARRWRRLRRAQASAGHPGRLTWAVAGCPVDLNGCDLAFRGGQRPPGCPRSCHRTPEPPRIHPRHLPEPGPAALRRGAQIAR